MQKHPHLLLSLLLLLAAPSTYGQLYTGLLSGDYWSENVDKSASGNMQDLLDFEAALASAYAGNRGGNFYFHSGTPTPRNEFRGAFGAASENWFYFGASQTMQNIGTTGSFLPTSGSYANTQSADSTGYTLVFELRDQANVPLEHLWINQIGLVVLSRNATGGYPVDVRATVTLSDASTQSLTATIGTPRGEDDTFFGFAAPGSLAITALQLESFAPGTTTPVSTRIAFDDIAFVAIPEPATLGLAFGAFALLGALAWRRGRTPAACRR